jgi:hypothetical protein
MDYQILAKFLALGLTIAGPNLNLDWFSKIAFEQTSACLYWQDDMPGGNRPCLYQTAA